MNDGTHELEIAAPSGGGLLSATMCLRWVEAEAFPHVPVADAGGWRGPFKLQQWWERVGAPGGEWRDVPVAGAADPARLP